MMSSIWKLASAVPLLLTLLSLKANNNALAAKTNSATGEEMMKHGDTIGKESAKSQRLVNRAWDHIMREQPEEPSSIGRMANHIYAQRLLSQINKSDAKKQKAEQIKEVLRVNN